MLEVRLLGKFNVSQNGESIAITSRPAQSLFAYLILNAGTAHRREKLAGMLWPDSLEETARDNLRHALWRVRKALESGGSTRFLHANDVTISFKTSSEYWLDATELQKVSENASANELLSVLSAYAGELLPGFYDEWVVLQREHLASVFEHHMARLMSLLQTEHRWLDILDWAERWIKLGQKPEPAFRALMRAHAAKGDMSKVAATYERCVKSLKEFGIEPSEQTRALYQRLKAGKESLEPGPAIPAKEKREESPRTNLPVPLTSFVGRERETEEVRRLLGTTRLLTLTGPGGIGKTRLAIQAASDLAQSYRDGVWWVELAPLADGTLLPQVVAQVLDVRESPGQPLIEALKDFLHEKQTLLVLDNCEHLISACAQLAYDLLSQCAKLRILVTSREALGITGETTFSVPTLSFPVLSDMSQLQTLKEFESIQLFIERASAIQPDLALTQANAFAVTQICHRLDGLPLAIELAAARVRMLTLEEIARRLGDRFSLLAQGSRTALPRHQTLRATIDWSYELLSAKEQILLRRFSVFAGGFTLEAAEAVTARETIEQPQVIDLLGNLINKSLVILHGESGALKGETRYRLLETIREYTREKLESSGEIDRMRDRHLEFFMNLAEEAERNHFSSEQLVWFDRMEAEIDNLRAALDWSIADAHATDSEHGAWRQESGLRAIGALMWFWHRTYAREASERLRQMLAMNDKPTPGRARALYSLGFLYWTVNNFLEARLALEEALSISRNLDDRLTLARSLGYLGAVAAMEGDYVLAQSLLEESLSVARELGPSGRKAASWALAFLGDVHYTQGDYSRSKKLYQEAVTLTKEAHEKNMLGLMIRRLGYIALRQLDHTQATQYFMESLKLNQAVGHSVGLCASLTAFANLALAQRKTAQAAQLYGAVERHLNNLGSPLFYSDKTEYELGMSNLRQQLKDAVLDKAWTKGAEMTLDQAITLARKEL